MLLYLKELFLLAFYDKPTRAQLLAEVRAELTDLTSPYFWPDSELNSYLDDWQQEFYLQFPSTTLGVSTATTASGSVNLDSQFTSYGGAGRAWVRKSPGGYTPLPITLNTSDLDAKHPLWRSSTTTGPPTVAYYSAHNVLSFFPTPTSTCTYVFEYPKLPVFAGDSSYPGPPAHTKYSATYYCAYRALERQGPNHNFAKSAIYKRLFEEELMEYSAWFKREFPAHAPHLFIADSRIIKYGAQPSGGGKSLWR